MTAADFSHETDPIAYHLGRSWHFLELVDVEVANGEMEEASNKLWGAAAHAIKAVAERKGWRHGSHAMLEETVLRLIDDEAAPPRLLNYYRSANWFHTRFYSGPPHQDQIRDGQREVAEFIEILENL